MNRLKSGICAAALSVVFLAGGSVSCLGAEDYGAVASSEEQVSNTEKIGKYGMLPVYGRDIADGTYTVEVESSSTMFRVVNAELTVKDGEMEASITLSGTGYLRLFMGTSGEAAAAGEEAYIGFEEDKEGMYVYTIPVEALDKSLSCAAYSKRKAQWYDREILFDASSLPEEALKLELPDYELIEEAVAAYRTGQSASPAEEADPEQETDALFLEEEPQVQESEASPALQPFEPAEAGMEDGEYAIETELIGGSGKVTVNTPALFIVKDGKAYVKLQWSSTNYDYMIVGGEKYLNESEEGGYSVFTIPVSVLDGEMPVIGDTTAMGEPHEIEYSLVFYSDTIGPKSRMPQEAAKRVVAIALVIIVGGGILNHYVSKKKKV